MNFNEVVTNNGIHEVSVGQRIKPNPKLGRKEIKKIRRVDRRRTQKVDVLDKYHQNNESNVGRFKDSEMTPRLVTLIWPLFSWSGGTGRAKLLPPRAWGGFRARWRNEVGRAGEIREGWEQKRMTRPFRCDRRERDCSMSEFCLTDQAFEARQKEG